MRLPRVLAVAASVVAVLGLSGCGGAAADAVPTDREVMTVGGGGDVISFTTASGLVCDVFDTYKGGGVACDFDAFTPPSNWSPGVVEIKKVADGTLSVVVFADGHYCVTFDGYRSGGLTCSYPAETRQDTLDPSTT